MSVIDSALSQVKLLHPYTPGKPVEELERELGISNAIKLASNENPLGCSDLAKQAINTALENIELYPDANAFYLKQKLADKLGVKENQITIGNGSNDILDLLARTFLDEHAEAIFSEYAFQVPGHIAVVIDEAYFEYVDEENYADALQWLSEFENLVVTRTFSKIYGLAGLRLGYAISSAEISDLLNRIRQPFNANTLALAAATASLADDEFVGASRDNNQAGLQQLTKYFDTRGLETIPSVANFLTVRFGKQCDEIYQGLLQQGIILRPLANYNLPEFLRVTIGTPQQQAVLMERLDKLL
jgi:histidinol-phosphate aminotransferase